MKTKSLVFKQIIRNLFLFTGIFLLAYLAGCEKEDFLKKPDVKTIKTDNPTSSSILVTGEILNPDDLKVKTYGFCWSESEKPEITDNINKLGIDTLKGIYSSLIDGLKPGFKYYIRAYAENEAGIGYGESIAFETEDGIIEISTNEIINITDSSAISGGNLLEYGGSEILERGICWNKDGQPTIDDSTAISKEVTNSYSCNLHDLNYGTIYYVKAYAKNEIGIYYGDEISFRTDTLPIIITTPINNITETSAESGGEINDDGGSDIILSGLCWSISANPTINDSICINEEDNEKFIIEILNLEKNTDYSIRAFAKNSVGISYGNELSFRTNGTLPELTTLNVNNIGSTIARCEAEVLSDGGFAITSRGVCWNTSNNPTINDFKTEEGSEIGSFISNMTGLNIKTTYYVRSYATNSEGTNYGNELSFQTLDTLAIITTSEISEITINSAVSGGNITDNGGTEITSRGVCWNIDENPTIENDKTTDGSGVGNFISNISGLSDNTTYYVRAYAINNAGVSYGDNKSFTINSGASLPTITTSDISDVAEMTASGGGIISSDGGATISAKGVCWSTSSNPTTADFKTNDGTGIGPFNSSISGLSQGSTYYVRAYATNMAGTAYGDNKSFTTLDIPTVTTNTISDLTSNSATCGGNITNDGGTAVTERGVCWNTSSNPTVDDFKTEDGSGTGSFTSSLTGLTEATTYYVRAYAINSTGISYGDEITFYTPILPTVTTENVSLITSSTAKSGGNITDDGGGEILERGVCWSINPNPTLNDNRTNDGTGIGGYTSNISGLSSTTVYYLRAYATNNAGTAYGNEISFYTNEVISIGSFYEGGIIFYIDATGEHGLVCAPHDQSNGKDWGCQGTVIGTSTGLGTGSANTQAIVAGCSETNVAAKVCNDLILNGFDDWFLPSLNEFSLIYDNLIVPGYGNFPEAGTGYGYWTSSEAGGGYASERAYEYRLDDLTPMNQKSYSLRVRAVREF